MSNESPPEAFPQRLLLFGSPEIKPMTMETGTNYEVKLGFWTNWTNGKILGATMTLTRQHGGFLIAFLAIFVGVVGKSFWRLGCFTIHRWLSSAEPQDGLYHQRQAILRNSDSAFDGIVRLLSSMLAWRSGHRARRPISRLLPIVVTALTIWAAFGVASIFSSSVTSETLNQVLLKGNRCGVFDPSQSQNGSTAIAYPYQTEKASQYLNYGRQCYVDNTHVDGCNVYTKPRLPLNSTRGSKCPFGDDICKTGDDNLVMDTGRLDSLEHLGINIAPEYRFQMRLLTTCAPLKTQGYTSDYNDSDYGAVKRYLYGQDMNWQQTNNFIYEIPLKGAYEPKDNATSGNVPRPEYQLGSTRHWSNPNDTIGKVEHTWRPIDTLMVPNADLHIFFMSAPGIYYSAPVADPWFSAQRLKNRTSSVEKKTIPFWMRDEPLGVMACIQQIQFCNPRLPEKERCEPLRGVFDPRRAETWAKIFPSEEELETIYWVDLIYGTTNQLSDTVYQIGAAALRARYSLSGGFSGPLPGDQWQLEAEHLNKGSLASLQDALVQTANGLPESLDEFRMALPANTTMPQRMCSSQKIVSNSHSSFNVLGVGLILTIGALIIMLDLCLGPVVKWWRLRKHEKQRVQDTERGSNEVTALPLYSALEWSQTSILQLQRLAHESAGYGYWEDCNNTVPVTQQGDRLGCLDLTNLRHPLLHSRKECSSTDSKCIRKEEEEEEMSEAIQEGRRRDERGDTRRETRGQIRSESREETAGEESTIITLSIR